MKKKTSRGSKRKGECDIKEVKKESFEDEGVDIRKAWDDEEVKDPETKQTEEPPKNMFEVHEDTPEKKGTPNKGTPLDETFDALDFSKIADEANKAKDRLPDL